MGKQSEILVNSLRVYVKRKHLTMLLSEWLRDEHDLTGTKIGCGIGVCGSCTVLIDNQPIKSCKKIVSDVLGTNILTIEGLHMTFLKMNEDIVPRNEGLTLHPLQKAFLDQGAVQCGFCTPGMVLTAHSLLIRNNHPTRDEVRRALAGNLCRCTGYQQIIDAVMKAASYYK